MTLKLTKRERDVAALVHKGMMNKEIAHALGLSRSTVRNRISSIFDKTGCGNRVELALLVERGLLEENDDKPVNGAAAASSVQHDLRHSHRA